jgi:hypothetical protein
VAVTPLKFPARAVSGQRAAERRRLVLPARLTWKDQAGAVRFVSVTTRDISDAGAFVECEAGAAIPLYRIVHLQLERAAECHEALPASLRDRRVLSAVWRVAPCRPSTGTPAGYALRFLRDPKEAASGRPAVAAAPMAVAS